MTQPSPSSTSSPAESGAVERVARIIDPEAFKSAEELSKAIRVGHVRDYGDGEGPQPYTQEDAIGYGRSRYSAHFLRRSEALAKAEAILTTLNVGELVTALEEIKNLKAVPIGDTGFQVGPLALLQAAQRIARAALLRFRGASS